MKVKIEFICTSHIWKLSNVKYLKYCVNYGEALQWNLLKTNLKQLWMGPHHPAHSFDFITYISVSTMFRKFFSSLSFFLKKTQILVIISIMRKCFLMFLPLQFEVLNFACCIYSIHRGAEGHLINYPLDS